MAWWFIISGALLLIGSAVYHFAHRKKEGIPSSLNDRIDKFDQNAKKLDVEKGQKEDSELDRIKSQLLEMMEELEEKNYALERSFQRIKNRERELERRFKDYQSFEEVRFLSKKKMTKEKSNFTGHPRGKEILRLSGQGLKASEIAEKLNLGIREVELVLKISNWGEGRFAGENG